MMKIVAMTAILSTLLLVVSCTNDTSNYDAGIEAYKRKHYEVALYDFEKWANKGDSKAQFCLGYMYKHGQGVKPDDEEAMAWYTKAAQKGYAPAQNNLAKMYNDGWLNSKGKREGPYLKKAVELWEQAAEKDSSNAQANLGFVYFAMAYPAESLNLEKDKELLYLKKAEELLKKAAKPELSRASHLRASHILGLLYSEKGREAVDNEDVKSANEWYKMAEDSYTAAAEKGDMKAQADLASMYYYGAGVAQSLTEDERWKKAFNWYTKAADQKFAASQQSLAFMYYLGQGVAPDPQKAVELWKKAANQGNAVAQNNLANTYSSGEGMSEPNPEMALRYSFLAAQQGEAIAQFNIGQDFEIGSHGLSQDNAEAYYWYGLALRDPSNLNSEQTYFGNKTIVLGKTIIKDVAAEVTKRRENVKKKLPDEKHRNEIQERVDSWKPKGPYSSGTGFYIAKNYILTNAHVVTWEGHEGKRRKYDEFRIPYRRVELIAWNYQDFDLALLYDKYGNTDTATLSSHPVDFGDGIASFGYPVSDVLSYEGNGTSGIVSGLSGTMRDFPDSFFQHTAPIQSGNSGGPVFDHAGNVVGVTVAELSPFLHWKDGRIEIENRQNVNFAIKFDVIQKFLKENNITVNPVTKDKGTENSDKINLREIYAKARKFTVPVLSFKNKENKLFETDFRTIDTGILELK